MFLVLQTASYLPHRGLHGDESRQHLHINNHHVGAVALPSVTKEPSNKNSVHLKSKLGARPLFLSQLVPHHILTVQHLLIQLCQGLLVTCAVSHSPSPALPTQLHHCRTCPSSTASPPSPAPFSCPLSQGCAAPPGLPDGLTLDHQTSCISHGFSGRLRARDRLT